MITIPQSILAPGFFTMASNVVTSSMKEISPEMPRWVVKTSSCEDAEITC